MQKKTFCVLCTIFKEGFGYPPLEALENPILEDVILVKRKKFRIVKI